MSPTNKQKLNANNQKNDSNQSLKTAKLIFNPNSLHIGYQTLVNPVIVAIDKLADMRSNQPPKIENFESTTRPHTHCNG